MNDALTHEQIRDLLPLYVLGALQGAEECEVVCGHLATGCLGCSHELAQLARAAAAIGGTLPSVAPSAASRERLEQAMQKQRREQAPKAVRAMGSRRMAPPRWAFSAVAALAIAATAYSLSQADELRRERQQRWGLEKYVFQLQDQQRRLQRDASEGRETLAQLAGGEATIFTLSSADGSAAGSGRIVWNKKNRQWTLIADLPALPADKAYELWFITGDQKEAIAGGKFRPDESGLVRYTVPLPSGREDLVIGAVTLEPATESAEDAAKPAAKPFLVGKAPA